MTLRRGLLFPVISKKFFLTLSVGTPLHLKVLRRDTVFHTSYGPYVTIRFVVPGTGVPQTIGNLLCVIVCILRSVCLHSTSY